MVSFVLPNTSDELFLLPVVHNEILVWAMSWRRTAWDTMESFLRARFGWCHTPNRPMFTMREGGYGSIIVKVYNRRDADLLLGRAYFCGSEIVAFTRIYPDLTSVFNNATLHPSPADGAAAVAGAAVVFSFSVHEEEDDLRRTNSFQPSDVDPTA